MRRYAEDGLIAPARRSGDRGWEYDESDLEQVRFLKGVESLGIAGAAIRELADDRHLGDCAAVRQPMAEQAAARLVDTQTAFDGSSRRRAAAGSLAAANRCAPAKEDPQAHRRRLLPVASAPRLRSFYGWPSPGSALRFWSR